MSEPMDVDEPITNNNSENITTGNKKKRFEIKKWTAVAFWAWDQTNDHCAICRNFLMDGCIDCHSKGTTDNCKRATGECGHVFHLHCIKQWIEQRAVCPLDNKQWTTKEVSD
ncbi:SCF ubiquitin ligase complex subunit [Martiniozyma asiatica (nom. inval.)]|nr:SCF ubiquitin ligase complex subunit [Martiniozyma asiatica]